MNKQKQLEEVHNSLINGQRKQMVKQIDSYGLYEFWNDYNQFLTNEYPLVPENLEARLEYFTDATISYFRIKNR